MPHRNLFFLFVLLLGGCGSSDAPVERDLPLMADPLTDSLSLQLDGQSGRLILSPIPKDPLSVSPLASSYPDTIQTTRGSGEVLELVFSKDTNLSELYVAAVNASSHIALDIIDEDNSSSSKAVNLTVDLPSDIDEEDFCLEVSARDVAEKLSNTVETCFVFGPENADNNRVIYFADFSSRSTLYTLDFDTRQVSRIGNTGIELTDIAFLGESLYGITFESWDGLKEKHKATMITRMKSNLLFDVECELAVDDLDINEGVISDQKFKLNSAANHWRLIHYVSPTGKKGGVFDQRLRAGARADRFSLFASMGRGKMF